jgi:hypothetical protein
MKIYTQTLKWVGIIYMIAGLGLSIAGYLFRSKFVAGETLNTVGFMFSSYGFWFLVAMGGVYWLIFRPSYDIVLNYNRMQSVVFSIIFIYAVFTLIFVNDKLENGLTTAFSKLMTFLATTIMLGYFVYVGSKNILKSEEQ